VVKKQNLILNGPTGWSKTYLTCAIGRHACHLDYGVRYYRATRLFEALTISHGDGSYLKLIGQIEKADLLIIDDWGLETLTQSQRNDLLKIMEDRYGINRRLLPVSYSSQNDIPILATPH
jgi:DNA replication protein DnaC